MPNAKDLLDRHRYGVSAAIVGAFVLGGWVLSTASVPCSFARLFHVPCPGCGSTRAMLCLFQGDLAGVVRMSPLAPFMCLFFTAFAVQIVASILRSGSITNAFAGRLGKAVPAGVIVVALLEVVVWALRFGGLFGGPVPV